MSSLPPGPIIVTLQLDAATDALFQSMRRTHFPPALNRIPAHLTLFHALPGGDPDAVVRTVAAATRRPPFRVRVEGLMPLGRGVAYRLASPELLALRAAIAAPFSAALTPQDREKFRPHVTIQNKVSPAEARATLARLSTAFVPFDALAEGVQLWRYLGGPWGPLAAVALSG